MTFLIFNEIVYNAKFVFLSKPYILFRLCVIKYVNIRHDITLLPIENDVLNRGDK